MGDVTAMPRVYEVPAPKVVTVKGGNNREYRFSLPASVAIRMEEAYGGAGGFQVTRITHVLEVMSWCAAAAGMTGVTVQEIGRAFTGKLLALQETIMDLMNAREADARSLAPYVPTDPALILRALDMVSFESGDVVIDPGCGDGRVLTMVAERGGYAIGYEINKERAAMCRTKAEQYPDHIEVYEEDGRNAPFDRADIVFLYLLTASNEKLRPLLEQQLKPGARVVSHDFPVNGVGWRLIAREVIESKTLYAYSYEPVEPVDNGGAAQ